MPPCHLSLSVQSYVIKAFQVLAQNHGFTLGNTTQTEVCQRLFTLVRSLVQEIFRHLLPCFEGVLMDVMFEQREFLSKHIFDAWCVFNIMYPKSEFLCGFSLFVK